MAKDTEHLLIIEAGHAPENTTGELRKFAPDLVLIIDTAEMDQHPGTVQWIPEEAIDGMSASTHSLPLSMLARYLTLDLHCTVTLLGIQPGTNEVDESVPKCYRPSRKLWKGWINLSGYMSAQVKPGLSILL